MGIDLSAKVEGDGRLALTWFSDQVLDSVHVLLVRTGTVPSHTSLHLGGDVAHCRFDNLSRHQRYRVGVLGTAGETTTLSDWFEVTPRGGLEARILPPHGLSGLMAGVGRLMVMPQPERLTAFWRLERGFVDRVILEVLEGNEVRHRLELEPEVRSISLDHSRRITLKNGHSYGLRVRTAFAGALHGCSALVAATPAAAGEERRANQNHLQENLLFPSVAVSPEVRIFPDDEDTGAEEGEGHTLVCCHCQEEVRWHDYKLLCRGCSAEFVPNGRGVFLEASRLRFGTCRCCLPRKILVQKPGLESLTCAHSGKEHLRVTTNAGGCPQFHLIEDLPFGLCQCCRPRRALVESGRGIVCSQSAEIHRRQGTSFVLVPSQPVFDAAAIDELLDAGLAEICATGISQKPRSVSRRSVP